MAETKSKLNSDLKQIAKTGSLHQKKKEKSQKNFLIDTYCKIEKNDLFQR